MMHKTGQISEREFDTYRSMYQAMTASVLLPSVCVRLRVDPAVAASRISRRAELREGRRSELTIDLGYLRALDEEIETTVDILRGQGVRVLDLNWGSNLGTPEERADAIHILASQIVAVPEPDLFQLHHRRVIT